MSWREVTQEEAARLRADPDPALRKSLLDTQTVFDIDADQETTVRRERNFEKKFYMHISYNSNRHLTESNLALGRNTLLGNLGTNVTKRQAYAFYEELQPNIDKKLCFFHTGLRPAGRRTDDKNSSHDKKNENITYFYTVVDGECVAAMAIDTDYTASNSNPLAIGTHRSFTDYIQRKFALEEDEIPIYVDLFCADVKTIKGAGAIAYDHLYNYLLNKEGRYVICLTALNNPKTLDFYEGRNMKYVKEQGWSRETADRRRPHDTGLIEMKAVVGRDNPPSDVFPRLPSSEERRQRTQRRREKRSAREVVDLTTGTPMRKKAVWEEDEDDIPIHFPSDDEAEGTGISNYTKQKAKKLGVKVRESKQPKKKLDIYKDGEHVASIGAKGYKDYPSHLKEKGESFAKERRSLYKKRHEGTRHKIGTPSYYADQLLW